MHRSRERLDGKRKRPFPVKPPSSRRMASARGASGVPMRPSHFHLLSRNRPHGTFQIDSRLSRPHATRPAWRMSRRPTPLLPLSPVHLGSQRWHEAPRRTLSAPRWPHDAGPLAKQSRRVGMRSDRHRPGRLPPQNGKPARSWRAAAWQAPSRPRCFDPLQDVQDLWRRNLRNRALAEFGARKAQKPIDLGEGALGLPFAALLFDQFVGQRIEGVR